MRPLSHRTLAHRLAAGAALATAAVLALAGTRELSPRTPEPLLKRSLNTLVTRPSRPARTGVLE